MITLDKKDIINLLCILSETGAEWEIRKVSDDEPQSFKVFPTNFDGDKIEESGAYLIVRNGWDNIFDSVELNFCFNPNQYVLMKGLSEMDTRKEHVLVFRLADSNEPNTKSHE